MPWNITFIFIFFASTRIYVQDLALWNDYIKCSPVFSFFIFLFLSLFFFLQKKSLRLYFFIQVGTNETNKYLCYSSRKCKLHDGCFEKILKYNKSISRGMSFEKYTTLNISWDKKKKSKRPRKKKKDYIANSQCGGLYSYGKLWK